MNLVHNACTHTATGYIVRFVWVYIGVVRTGGSSGGGDTRQCRPEVVLNGDGGTVRRTAQLDYCQCTSAGLVVGSSSAQQALLLESLSGLAV